MLPPFKGGIYKSESIFGMFVAPESAMGKVMASVDPQDLVSHEQNCKVRVTGCIQFHPSWSHNDLL
jgi:hypothetical protein